MNINLHIERLVLDGLPITRSHGPLVQAAIAAELSRLLTEHGLGADLQTGGRMPRMQTNAIQLTPDSDPTQVGTQIAQSVYGGIGNDR